MAKDASDHNRDHNVAVIKKVPVIAVKYPVPGGQVMAPSLVMDISYAWTGEAIPDPLLRRCRLLRGV
jgi:hypothetical protein